MSELHIHNVVDLYYDLVYMPAGVGREFQEKATRFFNEHQTTIKKLCEQVIDEEVRKENERNSIKDRNIFLAARYPRE